jgi:integrase/recombinase XerD
MPGRGRFKDDDAWPEPDGTRWRRGLSPASLLDVTGHAAKWREGTISKVGRAYATYLHWLETTGQLNDDEPPEQRFTPVRLDAYCAYHEPSVEPTTIRSQLTDLVRALSVLAPKANVTFIRRRSYCYPKCGDRLVKRQRMQESAALLQLGLDLMNLAESAATPTRRHALLYRDGLMIALLACRLMRLRNLTSIEIGRHLTELDGCWSLEFSGAETKNHRQWINLWPKRLVPHLLKYLEIYRPLLVNGRYEGNSLWISLRYGPLTDNGIYYAITTRTRDAFGWPINPHLFRDAAATSLAIHDPANVKLSRHVLGHGNYRTSEESYNQAQSIQASASLNAAMEKLRRQRKDKKSMRRNSSTTKRWKPPGPSKKS